MRWKTWIRRVLWSGIVLSFGVIVAAALWQSLRAVGDTVGSRVAGGIALGLLSCWIVNGVVLVVLLALELLSVNGNSTEHGDTPNDSDRREP